MKIYHEDGRELWSSDHGTMKGTAQAAVKAGANLRWAVLSGTDLRWAVLSGTDLSGADLREANLSWAGLRWADLREADLRGADLSEAKLTEANLTRANLREANLTGTCLDPSNKPNGNAEGFTNTPDGLCIGYRTKQSYHCGSTTYTPGEHVAPWFSTCPDTDCHPGLYCYPTPEQVSEEYPGKEQVTVTFKSEDCHRAGGKWRVKKFTVV